MCRGVLVSSLLLLLLWLVAGPRRTRTEPALPHVRVMLPDPGSPRQAAPTNKPLLWTSKRSPDDGPLDSPDMRDWVFTGRPTLEHHILTSPRNCCAGYSMTIEGAEGTHVRLVFLNVYLLRGSAITIQEADVEQSTELRPSHPPYPRLVAQSKANVLHITIEEVSATRVLESQELPSFEAVYWEVPSGGAEWRRKPYTQCPVSHEATYGGQVSLPASGPVSPQDYVYDCIWVVRIPTTGWGVYVRITQMDLHGLLEVRHGLNASSPLLATNGNTTSLHDLHQPSVGYWGRRNGGIYVRVVKPIDDGFLTFVYGIAKLPENNECKFHYRGYFLMQGWNCEKPSMCIPVNNTCNGVENCPLGQDEDRDYCQPSQCQHAYEKQCWSGECVHRLLEFCPEEPCPRDRPFRCDWFRKCYSQIDKCNGIHYCDDGKDERGCPKTSKGLSTKTIVIIVCVSGLFTILPSIILCCWDDPVERDLQRAQEAFTNLCDLYSGRTLLTQIQAARRAGTLGVDQDSRTTNHRPTYPRTTNQEEVILLAPPDPADTPAPASNSLIVPATETASPRRPPRSLPNLTPPPGRGATDSSSTTSPTHGSGSRASRGSQGSSRGSSSSPPADPEPPPAGAGGGAGVAMLSPPPYLLQPDVAALEHPLPEEDHHTPPPCLSPPGGATADGLPPDTEAPPPYESVQHLQHASPQPQRPHHKPPAYSH